MIDGRRIASFERNIFVGGDNLEVSRILYRGNGEEQSADVSSRSIRVQRDKDSREYYSGLP